MQRRTRCALFAAPLLLLLTACSPAGAQPEPQADAAAAPLAVTHLATMQAPDGLAPFEVPLGGLSGIDYDPATGAYLVVSDDRAEKGPARAYTLNLDLDSEGRFTSPEPKFTAMTLLTNEDGEPYPVKGVDPESIRLAPGSTDLVYSSEGDASIFLAPFIRAADPDGRMLRDYALPEHYLPTAGEGGEQTVGVRNNLAFEGLTFSADGARLLALTESALIQDGPIATPQAGTDSRVLIFDSASGEAVDEFVYAVEPISGEYPDVVSPTGFTITADRGATEILALSEDEYLVIERGSVPGKGFEAQVYWTTTAGASSVRGQAALDGTHTPMPKRLLFDFADTGASPDNVEGITWGPTLADGTRTLVLVADDNFNPEGGQHTMFHVLAVR